MTTLPIEAYCEAFGRLRDLRDKRENLALVDVLEDELDEIWQGLTVEECREVERRYPELRLRRLA